MSDEKGFSLFYIFLPMAVLVILLIAGFFLYQSYLENNHTPVVTQTPPTDTQKGQTYTNSQYGFSFDLPDSWNGYSIVNTSWQGITLDGSNAQIQGPKIIIHNPKSTDANNQWQDIPVMIFTKDEWNLVLQEKISLGAAPIGPSKLGENQNYVFALPARWIGFTDAQGQDEATAITKTFKSF